MSQQIQITGGAKVRDLQDVIIGTSGVLSSVAFNVANGVPKLDSGGKILVSQLPNSVMEYKGTWNAATNTPTLTNGGAFNQGDVYLCDTAGTVNFGSSSPISFIVGDQAIYSGSVWQKAGGATGTVTSVGLSTNAGAITIGNSPITTSGTITANFNGTNLQYVNGAGNLTTFPDLSVYVTLAGTQTITGSKTFSATSLTLAPSSGGGTLNLKQDAFLGATNGYTSLTSSGSDFAIIAATGVSTSKQAVFSLASLGSTLRTYTLPDASGTIALTSDIPILTGYVPYTGATGSVNLGAYLLTASGVDSVGYTARGNGTLSGYLIIKQGTTYLGNVVGYNSINANARKYVFISDVDGTNYKSAIFELSSLTNNTDRTYTLPDATGTIALTTDIPSITGLVPYTGATTNVDLGNFSATGNTSNFRNSYINGTASVQGQLMIKQAVLGSTNYAGYSSIYSTGSNITVISDVAGTTYKSAILSFGSLTNNTDRTYTFPDATGTIALVGGSGVGTVTSVAALTIGTSGTDLSSTVATSTTTPVITLNVPTASAANRGALSSADWTTFNNKQSALTNPVTGTGTTNYLPKFTGASTIGNSNITDTGSLITLGSNSYVNGNVGIGSTPSTNIGLLVSRNITGGVTSYGTYSNGTIQSDVATTATYHATFIGTAAASFTVNNAYGHYVAQTTIGAGSAISTQQAFYAHSNFTGATNNYGFRGLIPSGTNRWNLYMDGTANNYLAGNLGIGNTSVDTTMLRIGKVFTSTLTTSLFLDSQASLTATSLQYIQTAASTAASITLSTLSHISLTQGTFGAGSTVTTQFGIYIGNLIGATNNYGIFGDIASGTGRWNLYMNGTANNYMAGSLGIGATALTGISLYVGKNITGATTSYGVVQNGTVQSGVTSSVYSFVSSTNTAASAFTLSNYYHFYAAQNTIGATSSVTNQYGFIVENSLTGATNNYGFFGNIPSGTNRWNLYMAGTAANYMAGVLNIGSTTLSGYTLDVNGTARVVNNIYKGTVPSAVQSSYSGLIVNNGTANQNAVYSANSIVSVNDAVNAFVNFTISTTGLLVYAGGAAAAVSSSILELQSTTKGFLPPRMTSAQRTAIGTPATGLIVYQTDGVEGLYVYSGGSWKSLTMV
jgi:hypothetical protein